MDGVWRDRLKGTGMDLTAIDLEPDKLEGAELSRAVHEHVMGLCLHEYTIEYRQDEYDDTWYAECQKCGAHREGGHTMIPPTSGTCPAYASEMDAAWKIVLHVTAMVSGPAGMTLDFDGTREGKTCSATFVEVVNHIDGGVNTTRAWESWHTHMPTAICRAALKVMADR